MSVLEFALPKHVAIVMDGNGRWAKARNLDRIEGHKEGAGRAEEIILAAKDQGIECLTLYTFSKENWGRDADEVHQLLQLITQKIATEDDFFHQHQIRLRILGQLDDFPEDISVAIRKKVQETAQYSGIKVNFCLSYGSQQDIVGAVQKVITDWRETGRSPEDLTPEIFTNYLSGDDTPAVDFFIRTSGELRLSNFLLWELAYAELYFTTTLWPDFSALHFRSALQSFARRQRRYGK